MSRVGETGFDIVIDKDDPINEIRMFSEIDDGLLKVYVAPGAGENTAVLLVTPDATGIENPIGAPTIFASFGNRVEYASEDRRKFSEAAKQATERRVSAIRDGNESGRRMK
ncbi:MAG: hypothetical protein ING19_06780 [Azospirillum sp.]|nr:hypothetical protein [Azospirillum sp.]